jgi:hypothetical protein
MMINYGRFKFVSPNLFNTYSIIYFYSMKTLSTIIVALLFSVSVFAQSAIKDTLIKGSIEKNCPGGFNTYNDFITMHTLPSPEMATKKKAQGCVHIAFTIEPDSTMSNIHATTNLGYRLEDMAIMALKKSSGWLPTMVNGRNVRTSMEVGVNFIRLPGNLIKIEGMVIN